jgi:hyperosmotically inducible periplasmic protein
MTNKTWLNLVLTTCLSAGWGIQNLQAQQTEPDNTRTNRQDRSMSEPTADQSKNNRGDLELAQKIRKSIVDDPNLSTYAHNVKVIARDGRITLKGPVRSEEEKRILVQKATEQAGAGNVTDELTVKGRS